LRTPQAYVTLSARAPLQILNLYLPARALIKINVRRSERSFTRVTEGLGIDV
jgi:hypothetical protein